MFNEADTCRKYVVPKLQASGWESEPHSIAEQRYFTDVRIVVHGNTARRHQGKRADYLLRFSRDTLQAEVDALKRLQAETAQELEALLPAILDRAFRGEL